MKKTVLALFLIILAVVFCVSCKKSGNNDETLLPVEERTDIFTLTYNSAPNGTIEGNTTQRVQYGMAAEVVVAIPDDGYVFVEWTDGLKSEIRRDVFVKSDITVAPVFEKKDSQALSVLGVPEIHINTDNSIPITSKEYFIPCDVSIDAKEEIYDLEPINAEIRGRGNSSWDMEKKSYKIKFSQNQSLFGSDYEAKDWNLLANHTDKTLSRNALAYELSERMQAIKFSSMHQFVEVYLNGRYDGVYLLCDQIESGEGRVELDEEPSIDGDVGYLLEIDARADSECVFERDYFTIEGDGEDGKFYRIRTPDTEDKFFEPEIYISYIKGYLEETMAEIRSKDGDWEKICELIDVDSFAEEYIIQELFANLDNHSFSFFLYKEKGGKLYCGPVWDFDISSGNNNYGMGNANECLPNQDLIDNGEMWTARTNPWFRRLLRHGEFYVLVQEKLNEYEQTIKDVIALASTDPEQKNSYYNLYKDAFERNFKRWNIMGSYQWPQPYSVYTINTVNGQFDYLYNWLTERHKIVRNTFAS